MVAMSAPLVTTSHRLCVQRDLCQVTEPCVNRWTCQCAMVTCPRVSMISSVATMRLDECADKCHRESLSKGSIKYLKSFNSVTKLSGFFYRNVTIQDVKWENKCETIVTTRPECVTNWVTKNRTVTKQECDQYFDDVCSKYNVPQYEVVSTQPIKSESKMIVNCNIFLGK